MRKSVPRPVLHWDAVYRLRKLEELAKGGTSKAPVKEERWKY